jgi:hypothetical protein
MRRASRSAVVAVGTVGFVFFGGASVMTSPNGGAAGGGVSRATEVALAETGGGRVTETETGDDGSFYEVEVILDDGRCVDVQIDESFTVVSARPDPSTSDDD